ncbi:MAG: PKD domain-containing protein [Bacteroidia bacterium]|nr:PKD domain-containing protein [Bacteroidia bacterium]
MQHILLTLIVSAACAQTIFYQEDFNSGSAVGWTLNSSDLGGSTDPYNRWVVDAPYTPSHTQTSANPAFCQFNDPQFCQSVSGPAVPSQPSGITGNPNSPFLYISFNPSWGTPTPACTAPSQTPFLYIEPTQMFPCYPAQSAFAKTGPISIPAGTQAVKVSFFWLCQGGPNAYGQVYYSTNGTTWNPLSSRGGGTTFNQRSNWYADTITLSITRPATVYLGFRFVNNSGGGGSEPPFGIDELRVWEPSSSPPPSVTITMTPPVAQVCAGSGLTVSFSTTGTFDPSNTFTVQLSDATGSFSNPTAIGSGSSSPISCLIPSTLPSGTYRVRIVSSSPAATSNDEPITVISFAGLTCNANPNPATPGSTVTFTLGGTGLPNGPFSITWDPDDGSGSQTTSAAALPANLTHTYANQGAYAVSFRITHTGSGCFQDCAVPLVVSASTALPQISYTEGYLQVQSASLASIEIYDGLGRLLYRGIATGPIPLPETGVYLVRVSTREGTSIARVFVP